MKVHILVIFLFGILNAFALTDKHEEESKESSDQALKFLKGTAEGYGLRTKIADRIVRGEEAEKNGLPWIGSLRYKGTHYCAGSFIGDRYVLTVAKCLNFERIAKGNVDTWTFGPKNYSKEYTDTSLYEVVLGDHYLNTTEPSEEQRFGMVDFIALEHVTNRSGVALNNDVAVIKLDRPPKRTKYVSAIRLAKSSMGVSPGDELTFAGWGLSKRPNKDAKLGYVTYPEKHSNVLKVAQTTVIKKQKCANRHFAISKSGTTYTIGHPAGEDIICAKEKRNQGSPSKRDFGNPLMRYDPISKQYVLLGLYSYRWGRKSENGYTYVPYFYDKIHQMMNELKNRKH